MLQIIKQRVGVWCPDFKDRKEIENAFEGHICSINGIDSLFFKFHESGNYIRSTRSESRTYKDFIRYCEHKGYGHITAKELLQPHLNKIEKNYKI